MKNHDGRYIHIYDRFKIPATHNLHLIDPVRADPILNYYDHQL